jgi:hypothetical protein
MEFVERALQMITIDNLEMVIAGRALHCIDNLMMAVTIRALGKFGLYMAMV